MFIQAVFIKKIRITLFKKAEVYIKQQNGLKIIKE
mgnify:FL=1